MGRRRSGRGRNEARIDHAGWWLTAITWRCRGVTPGLPSRRADTRRATHSIRTAERHIANIYKKIGAHSQSDATAFAINFGLL